MGIDEMPMSAPVFSVGPVNEFFASQGTTVPDFYKSDNTGVSLCGASEFIIYVNLHQLNQTQVHRNVIAQKADVDALVLA